VPAAPPALGPRRATRPRRLVGRPAGDQQPAPGAVCAVTHCPLWPRADLPFCHTHANTWKVNGRPDVAAFVERFATVEITEDQIIRLDRLGSQLKLEIQYALQCRHHQRTTKAPPAVVMALVRALAASKVTSRLERSEDQWRTQIGRPAPKDSNLRALLIYARRQVEDLAEAGGWETEFDRDVWQMRRLGFAGNHRLDLTGIGQPWLRELVKRWLRWRPEHRAGVRGRPPRVALPDPLRPVLPAHPPRRASRDPPGPAGALPGRPARRAGRPPTPRRSHRNNSTHFCTRSGSTTGTTPCRPPR
jgi:hypothetical protein